MVIREVRAEVPAAPLDLELLFGEEEPATVEAAGFLRGKEKPMCPLGALGAFGGTRLVGSSPPPKPPGIPDTAEHFDMTFGDSASSGSGASTSNLAPRSPRVQVFACSPSVAVPLRSPTTLLDGLRVVEHDVLGQAHGGKLVAESLDCTLVVMDPV